MWDFSFSRAIGMVMQTLPFIVLRIIVYAGVALTYVFTVGIGGALGWGFGHIGASTDAPASGAFWAARSASDWSAAYSISPANIFCTW